MEKVTTVPTSEIVALFERERLPMVRMATLMVGSREIAEEIVQDAFSSVDQRWESLDRPGGYLRTVVVNGCAQVLRRRSTEARVTEMLPPQPEAEIPTQLVELRDALDRLGERQRLVIVLRYFVDIPDGEIAEMLDAAPSTVRSLARRALAALREELA